MKTGKSPKIPDPRTSSTLLGRVRNPLDRTGWERFYAAYAPVLLAAASRSSISEAHAKDIVQETMIEVAQEIAEFRYDRARGRFKHWLLTLMRRHIVTHFRRGTYCCHGLALPREEPLDAEVVEAIPAPAPDEAASWDDEWYQRLRDAALEELRANSDPRQFQIFHFHVLRGHSLSKVCTMFGVLPTRVYLIKHRLTQRLRRAVRRLMDGRVDAA